MLNDLLKQLEGKPHAVNVVKIIKRTITQCETDSKLLYYYNLMHILEVMYELAGRHMYYKYTL